MLIIIILIPNDKTIPMETDGNPVSSIRDTLYIINLFSFCNNNNETNNNNGGKILNKCTRVLIWLVVKEKIKSARKPAQFPLILLCVVLEKKVLLWDEERKWLYERARGEKRKIEALLAGWLVGWLGTDKTRSFETACLFHYILVFSWWKSICYINRLR